MTIKSFLPAFMIPLCIYKCQYILQKCGSR